MADDPHPSSPYWSRLYLSQLSTGVHGHSSSINPAMRLSSSIQCRVIQTSSARLGGFVYRREHNRHCVPVLYWNSSLPSLPSGIQLAISLAALTVRKSARTLRFVAAACLQPLRRWSPCCYRLAACVKREVKLETISSTCQTFLLHTSRFSNLAVPPCVRSRLKELFHFIYA